MPQPLRALGVQPKTFDDASERYVQRSRTKATLSCARRVAGRIALQVDEIWAHSVDPALITRRSDIATSGSSRVLVKTACQERPRLGGLCLMALLTPSCRKLNRRSKTNPPSTCRRGHGRPDPRIPHIMLCIGYHCSSKSHQGGGFSVGHVQHPPCSALDGHRRELHHLMWGVGKSAFRWPSAASRSGCGPEIV